MEQRSSRRIRELVTRTAQLEAYPLIRSNARWYPWWPGAPEFHPKAGYIDARPKTPTDFSCNAPPVHTSGQERRGRSVRFQSEAVIAVPAEGNFVPGRKGATSRCVLW